MKYIEELRSKVVLFSEILAELDLIRKVEKASEGAKAADATSGWSVPQRKRHLEELVESCGRTTKSAWEKARRQFDNYVANKKEEVFQGFLSAVEQYCGGPEKAKLTRREFEHLHIPARDDLRRCFSQDFFDADANAETYLDFAKRFLEHVDRVCEERGWMEAEIEKASQFVHPESAALAHHMNTANDLVVVRAKETTVVDGKTIPEGKHARITEHQYRALSRFFTKVQGKITSAMEEEIGRDWTQKREPKKLKSW